MPKRNEKPLTLWVSLSKHRLGLESELPADLRSLSLFEHLSDREEKALRHALVGRRYKAGEVVFREGEPGLGMYVVAKGEVEIVRKSGRTVAVLGPGDFFGEIALLSAVTRMASARAATEAELLILHGPAFDALIDRHPRLGVALLLGIARELGLRQMAAGDALDALSRDRPDAD